jgi:ABC-type multidrug transport system ATPase subunit
MSVLTGSEAPTAGAAFVSGLSLDLDDKTPIFATLGYCPQFDGLLELLSVREHLVMYGMIRGIREPLLGRCVDHYIRRLGLAPHAYKLSESLSGGNKRRLGLAVALMGNPRLLLLDEVSTGVDVMARRAMWSVLSAEMKLRSVVLTTHSMEEAEALCTRIGIMVNGELRCVGSAQRLKSRFGRGYQLELQTDDAPEASQRLRAFVAQRLSAEARVLEDFGGKLRFSVPHVDYPLSRIFRIIEDARQELHVRDYSLSQATLEQIFIAFARDQRDPAQ